MAIWNTPPGTTYLPGDDYDPHCEVCGKDVDACQCDPCETCEEQGNPNCVMHHNHTPSTMHPVFIDWLKDQRKQALVELRAWDNCTIVDESDQSIVEQARDTVGRVDELLASEGQEGCINSIKDLCDMLDVEEKDATADNLSCRLYKSTDCGASISVQCMVAGKPVWFHNGDDDKLAGRQLVGFCIQTIVEGSDAEVNGPFMPVGTSIEEIDKWIEFMEEEASYLWDEANEEDNEEE